MLAQLLIQFQKPIVVEQALAINGSRPLIDDIMSHLSNASIVDAHRTVRDADENQNTIHSANLFAPDYSIGMCMALSRPIMAIGACIVISNLIHSHLF